jgi:hypothetical protein
MIIYGPQGCGKTQHGEALRKHFGLQHVIESDDRPDVFGRSLYTPKNLVKFKQASGVLILTSQAPPADLLDGRRIMSFESAMAAAGLQLPQG